MEKQKNPYYGQLFKPCIEFEEVEIPKASPLSQRKEKKVKKECSLPLISRAGSNLKTSVTPLNTKKATLNIKNRKAIERPLQKQREVKFVGKSLKLRC